jgi:hypothetical protein
MIRRARLAALFFTAALACNNAGTNDGSADDAGLDAAPSDVMLPPTASGVTASQCAAQIDLDTMGAFVGNMLTIQGSTMTPTTVMAAPCNRAVTGQQVFRYHVRGDGVWLRATTAIPGGTDFLDTVLWALVGPCSENAPVLGCNDDDSSLDNALLGRSTLLTRSLARGTEIDLVVGAFNNVTRGAQRRGTYTLGVSEYPSAMGGAMCDSSIPGGCVPGFECVATSPTAGLCAQPGMEHEPNDTPATAEPARMVAMPTTIHASIQPAGDVDCFGIAVPANANLYIEANDGGGGCPADLRADLFRTGETLPFEGDDDSGRADLCPQIDPASNTGVRMMPAGAYVVCVKVTTPDGVTPTVTVPQYSLQMALVN